MECLAVVEALSVFIRPEAEVEAQSYQVDHLTGFGVVGYGRCGHNGVDNTKGDSLFSFRPGGL